MAKVKGVSVTLIVKEFVKNDSFNRPIYKDTEKEVKNVIIAPVRTEEVINTLNLTGKKAIYTLGIPKGDTNLWENTEVIFWGKKWRVIGSPLEGIESMIPLAWNKKIMVERYE